MRSLHTGVYDPYIERIRSLNLQDLIEETSEFGLDIHSLLILVNELREEIIKNVSRAISTVLLL
jgi:hypothetical protein